jgi:hypothetical protein
MRPFRSILLLLVSLLPLVALGQNQLIGNAVIQQTVRFTGDISPAALAADANDYAPTGFSTAIIVRLDSTAARNVTGLAGGAEGRWVWLINAGSYAITLKSQNVASLAVNRFAFSLDYVLQPGAAVQLVYDGTSLRWRTSGASSDVLNAIGAVATNGLLTRTGAGTYAARTITGTAGQITVTNGDGVSGVPTISLPSTITQATTFSAGTASTSTGTGAVILSGSGGLGVGGAGFFGGNVNVGGNAVSNPFVIVNGAAASTRGVAYRSAGLDRWWVSANSTAESGSNAGSNFAISAYNDAGTLIDSPLFIARVAGGAVTIARPLSVTNSTAASSTTTGSGIFSGGIGVAGSGYFGGNVVVAGSGYYQTGSTVQNQFSGPVALSYATNAGTAYSLTGSGYANYLIGFAQTVAATGDSFIIGQSGSAYAGPLSSVGNNQTFIYLPNKAIFARGSGATQAFTFDGTTLAVLPTTASTSTTTGALTVAGGAGIAGTVTASKVNATPATAAAPAGTTEHNNLYADYTGDAGGTSQVRGLRVNTTTSGANAFALVNGARINATASGSGTVASMNGLLVSTNVAGTNAVSSLTLVAVQPQMTGATNGNITDLRYYSVNALVPTSGDVVGTIGGIELPDIGRATATNVTGILVGNQTKGSGSTHAFRGLMASGSGKYNLFMDGTALNYLAGPLRLGSNGSDADLIASNTAALDFGSIAAAASADLTITVTGASTGDSVSLGLPAAPTAGIIFQGFVSASNTVTVRATNITGSPIDPASATYRATVTSF